MIDEIIYKDEIYGDENTIDYMLKMIPWISVTEARHECFMSINPVEYTYGSGNGIRTYTSVTMDYVVSEIMVGLNALFNSNYDVCFLNRYDNEKMALGWHADDSPEIDINHPIAVVSFGAEREIWVKEKRMKGNIPDENKFLLKDCSLFVMPAGFQKDYLHKIPKWDKPCKERVSLTFRKLS